MDLFLGDFPNEQNLAIRVFDNLKSLCGETVLQINLYGEMTDTEHPNFLNVLAYAGHMRWLRSTGETTPATARDWLTTLGDFVSVYPWQSINTVLDRGRTEISRSTFLACLQCHRKEKAPLAPTSFYQSSKLTPNWPKAIVVEAKRTGGYPVADPAKYGDVNENSPIKDKDWRGSAPVYPETENFITKAQQPFSLENLVASALEGDHLINKTGSLQKACRSFQEYFTNQQAPLVENARILLRENPDLMEDIAEIHHLGAIPKFRGRTPPEQWVRGPPP